MLAGEDVNQFYAGAIGRTDFGLRLRDLFGGTKAQVIGREGVEVHTDVASTTY